jgi:hypothetical protein
MDIEIEYIDLQSCNFTQTTVHGERGDWRVRKNITGEDLQTFPPFVSDELMYAILTFARKFELIAFNAGINFQKGKENGVLAARIQDMTNLNTALADENTRLATAIDYITSTTKE